MKLKKENIAKIWQIYVQEVKNGKIQKYTTYLLFYLEININEIDNWNQSLFYVKPVNAEN